MPSTLIHGATVLTVDAGDRVIEDGWVAIRDGRIAGVGPMASRPDPIPRPLTTPWISPATS